MASAYCSVAEMIRAHRREAYWHMGTDTCDVALVTTGRQLDVIWYVKLNVVIDHELHLSLLDSVSQPYETQLCMRMHLLPATSWPIMANGTASRPWSYRLLPACALTSTVSHAGLL